MATTLDKTFYNFKVVEQAGTMKIGRTHFKIATYRLETPSGEEIYVKSKTYNIFMHIDDLYDRLGKGKSSKTIREADYNTTTQGGGIPFVTYSHYGQQCWMPSRMEDMLSGGDTFDDKDVSKSWQSFAMNLSGPNEKVGSGFAYMRFNLAPPANSAEYEVFFTPSISRPVLRVTKKVLEDVISDNQQDDDGIYGNWKLKAITVAQARKDKLKLVGTDFLHLYHTWMREDDYRALWNTYKNATTLPIPFPTKNNKTIKAFANLNKGLNKGQRAVDGVEIRLTTLRMQLTAGKRTDGEGTAGATIMGKSATAFVALWDKKPVSTAEWLHRSAFSFGGIDVDYNMKSSDDPNNVVFGSTECNTDMIRAELMVKKLMAEHDHHQFEGFLTTTCIRKGNVTRKDLTKKDPQESLPDFLPNYPWLCFDLKYVFRMSRESSPFGCPLLAQTHFEPWSIYTPLAIEPRMDAWLINHLRTLYLPSKKSKMAKAFANSAFLDALSSSETTDGAEFDIAELAWAAAQAESPELALPGLLVTNPSVLAPEPTSSATLDGIDSYMGQKAFALPLETENPAPPQGFIIQGDVALFGTPIIGRLQKWMGPPPEDVVVGNDPPVWERVALEGDFHLSSLLPELKDTPYDVITFREVAFWHQNCEFDKTRAVGWYFDAQWVIDSSCGVLHDALRSVLGVDTPVLNIQAALGWDQEWDAPLDLHSFTLEGVFTGLTLSPMDGLRLTSIGVRLLGIRGFELNPEPHSTLSYGFGIFGTMAIDVPGTLLPLELAYNMGVVSESVNISAELTGEIWKNALGIEKLTLEDVSFVASFGLSSPWKSLSFSISATFWYLASQATFSGMFSPGSGQFELAAEFDDFSIAELDCLFYTLFGDSLSLPDYDVHIGSAVLSIASGTGLSVALHDVNIAGHTALDVGVSLSTSGVHFSGALSSNKISFGEVSVLDASLDISFWSEKEGKKVDFKLGGTLGVDFLHATVTAAVHLYPGDNGVEWTIIALLSAPDEPIAISEIVSLIPKGSFLDLSLKNAVVIAASRDDSTEMGLSLPRGCTIRQGVQVAADVDSFQALNDLHKGKVISDLVLSAGWSKELGFDLKISLPPATSLDFGHGARSGPISVEIQTKPVLQLAVSAKLTVPVKDSTSLNFSFDLSASALGASVTGKMNDWWDKPFGVENLKIGPTVGLAIGLKYVPFVATGTLTNFTVAAGLMIGDTTADVVMKISEDPKDELLKGHIDKLDISDLIVLGAKLVQADIPKIPNLLKFEKLDVYICPFGVNFGETTYPAGFSFTADILFLGHRADIQCKIDKTEKSISLHGGVDNFTLGPLTVHGVTGPRAELQCDLGVSKQILFINGAVELFDVDVQIFVNLEFLPDPTLKYHTIALTPDSRFLGVSRIITCDLTGELLGSSSLEKLKDADFSLTGSFANHVLDYVAQQIMGLLNVGNTADAHGIQAVQLQAEDARKRLQTYSANADHEFREAHWKWREHERSVQEANQHIIDAWMHELRRLTSEADHARRSFHGVQTASQDMAEEVARKQSELDAAADWLNQVSQQTQDEIKTAQRNFVEADALRAFAYRLIQDSIKAAKDKVAYFEEQIQDRKTKIQDYEAAPFWHVPKKLQLPALYTELTLVLPRSKSEAGKELELAYSGLNHPDYLQKVAKVLQAESELQAVEKVAQQKLSDALAAHVSKDEETQAATKQASDLLLQVEAGAEFVSLRNATLSLEAHTSTRSTIHDPARRAIDELMTSAEYLEYTSALGAVTLGVNSWISSENAQGILSLGEGKAGIFGGIVQALVKFGLTGLRPINIESISLSGTLRGALGFGGEHSRPLTARAEGYVLGVHFSEEVAYDPRDPFALAHALLTALWHILKSAATTMGGGVLPITVSKDSPAPMLPVPVSHTDDIAHEEVHALNTFENGASWLQSLLPPPLSQSESLFDTTAPGLHSEGNVMYIAPLIPVEDQLRLLPFDVARARFNQYEIVGTPEDAEQAKQRGLVAIPPGLFAANPPTDFSGSTAQ